MEKIDCLITPLSTIMLESAICGIPFALYIPKKQSECKSSFYGQENNLIYQEFIKKMRATIFLKLHFIMKIIFTIN